MLSPFCCVQRLCTASWSRPRSADAMMPDSSSNCHIRSDCNAFISGHCSSDTRLLSPSRNRIFVMRVGLFPSDPFSSARTLHNPPFRCSPEARRRLNRCAAATVVAAAAMLDMRPTAAAASSSPGSNSPVLPTGRIADSISSHEILFHTRTFSASADTNLHPEGLKHMLVTASR